MGHGAKRPRRPRPDERAPSKGESEGGMPRKRKPTTEKKRRSTYTYARKYADEEAFTLLLFSPWLLFGVMMRWLLCVTQRGPFLSFFFSVCPLFPSRPRSFGPRLTLSPKGGEERESARETEKARRGAKSRSWAFSLRDPPKNGGVEKGEGISEATIFSIFLSFPGECLSAVLSSASDGFRR